MREITLFPACIMDVGCPYCAKKGKIKFNRAPDKDFVARCSNCKERFNVKLNIREHYRKDISVLVSYSFKEIRKMDEPESYTGKITDLSKTGMAVESSNLWLKEFRRKKGRTLNFAFCLPPKNEIAIVKGIIRRIEELGEEGKFRMGISFVSLDETTNRKISFFLWN